MLKVAIIGCGKIADDHAAQIRRIKDCEIVAVCDREPLMARQLCERFRVKRHYSDLDKLLSDTHPDVVHVTTPPESHYGLARRCIEAGCNVYVEKPFTLCAEEAHDLIALATQKNLRITAGHDGQFTHVARRMRRLVRSGYLGDGPVHMESYYGYPLGNSPYARALLSDKRHWVRRLPGQLLQNIISHGIARIAEFLAGPRPEVVACGFVSAPLKSLGECELIDELRTIIRDEEGRTAYFTFSSQMRPSLHQFRIYGSKNGLMLDHDQEILIRLRGAKFTSYGEKFVPPVGLAWQHMSNLGFNVRKFLARDFHMKAGMKYLIESFYRSIVEGTADVIPYREILLTARIMDDIFEQVATGTQTSKQPGPAPVESGLEIA
jgi:predicted dehydrogenase